MLSCVQRKLHATGDPFGRRRNRAARDEAGHTIHPAFNGLSRGSALREKCLLDAGDGDFNNRHFLCSHHHERVERSLPVHETENGIPSTSTEKKTPAANG